MTEKKQMRFVGSEGFKEHQAIQKVLFDKTGNPLDGEGLHKVSPYAKQITNADLGRVTYYICTYLGAPLDPTGPYGRRERALDTKMQRVSKNTFDLYMTYLKTNNSIYLTKAQRGLTND